MRKTNLFYLKGNDTKFLTFSNYGEYLTGVCLSTNHKIWPSSFLCLNLPFDNTEYNSLPINDYNDGIGSFDILPYSYTVKNFKHFLMCYYENKLAVLRDIYEDDQNKKQEDIHGDENKLLKYLLEAISLFFNNLDLDSGVIQYFGDIVEHDYNGSYNDSICIVDFNRIKAFNVTKKNPNKEILCYETDQPLHNWNNELNNVDDNLFAITDTKDNKYHEQNFIDIEIGDKSNSTVNLNPDQITFNCVIPLFDIIDQNFLESYDNIDEDVEPNNIYKYIPYGIWFSSNNDKISNIKLNKENDNISQSWSLVVCSKFAPYPYGIKIEDNNNDLNRKVETYTYAELLANHSRLLSDYNNLKNDYNVLLSKINNLNDSVNNILQLYPEISSINIIDRVNEKLQENNLYVHQEIEDLRNEFNKLINQLRWKSINTSNEAN